MEAALHLLHLQTLIPTALGEEVHSAILTIQTACKFYNYEIWQDYLTTQKPDPASQSHDRPLTSQTIHIHQVGNLNAGDVTIQGNQIGETPKL